MNSQFEKRTAAGLEETVLAFQSSLAAATERARPFRHWLLAEAWPRPLVRALDELPIVPPSMTYRTGRREENNAARVFFDGAHQKWSTACDVLAASLQDPRSVSAIEALCGIDLGGTYLRIEYAQDQDGFWLERHTDVGAKRVSLLVYLSDGRFAPEWGTDLYDGRDGDVTRVPFHENHGLMFVPSGNTWHGFEKRPINGVRRSLIVNYVDDSWRSRHELCFPGFPVQ